MAQLTEVASTQDRNSLLICVPAYASSGLINSAGKRLNGINQDYTARSQSRRNHHHLIRQQAYLEDENAGWPSLLLRPLVLRIWCHRAVLLPRLRMIKSNALSLFADRK
ncbi:hypothetical protein [Pantoea sp. USHLN298]|uniref:hypothetical protein n=1 Tax=Pantoea sp. USHLN298 TaxID=3081294 RepID=UPI003017BB5F